MTLTPQPGAGRDVPAQQASQIPVILSTGSVFPAPTHVAFALAAELGFDGMEVMVGADPASQDPSQWQVLTRQHGVPVRAVHVPCLLVTQTVWGTEPWAKLQRSIDAAETVGADVVVLHPPFRWQREYAREFIDRLAMMQATTQVKIAVENMYPWARVTPERVKRLGRVGRSSIVQRVMADQAVELEAYRPSADLRRMDVAHATVDLSHTSAAHDDALELAEFLGERLAHVHLADGTGQPRDEHLVPGRGNQPCAEFLHQLVASDYRGVVCVEVSTRSAADDVARRADLAEALSFARTHLTPVTRQ